VQSAGLETRDTADLEVCATGVAAAPRCVLLRQCHFGIRVESLRAERARFFKPVSTESRFYTSLDNWNRRGLPFGGWGATISCGDQHGRAVIALAEECCNDNRLFGLSYFQQFN
jgi:hypothetical protein